MSAKYEVFQEKTHVTIWYWQLQAANGEIVAQGEGYRREADAWRATRDVTAAVLEVSGVADELAELRQFKQENTGP